MFFWQPASSIVTTESWTPICSKKRGIAVISFEFSAVATLLIRWMVYSAFSSIALVGAHARLTRPANFLIVEIKSKFVSRFRNDRD